MAQRVNKEEFQEKVLQADSPVLVEFYSDSCIPCKQLSPILGDLEDEYEGKLAVYKVNVNFETELMEEYQVMSSPTLLLFQAGVVKGTKRGLQKKQDLVEWITPFL